MQALTSHEFHTKHPHTREFQTMTEARAWQDANGGRIWHMTRTGAVRPGAPQWGAEVFFVTTAT